MILGISCFFHDSAVAVIDQQGSILYALHEERFSRVKHDSRFPRSCIAELAKRGVQRFDDVIYFEKPFIKFDRNIDIIVRRWPRSLNIAKNVFSNFGRQLRISEIIKKELRSAGIHFSGDVRFSEHHLSHIASAFFESSFDTATGITLDGVGESECGAIYILRRDERSVEVKRVFSLAYPNSVGLLYSAFTAYLGFKVNSGEYKVMGLAPYGTALYADIIEKYCLVHQNYWPDFKVDMSYFDFEGGQRGTTEKFDELFNSRARKPEEPLTVFHANVAASIQKVIQNLVVSYVNYAYSLAPSKNLVYAGGVALNCVANTEIEAIGTFKNIYVQPAAGDAGGALGAALLGYHLPPRIPSSKLVGSIFSNPRTQGPFLGFEYSDYEVERSLDEFGIQATRLDQEELSLVIAEGISNNLTYGLFRGRSEFGPRALGNRSIIANASVKGNLRRINQLIKYREGFRPFAPMILRSDFETYFQSHATRVDKSSMLFVAYLKNEYRGELPDRSNLSQETLLNPIETNSIFPSAIHLDFSARVQVIDDNDGTFISKLLTNIKKKTGYGILINTSFNLRGEPNVESPSDALSTYLRTNLDFLVLNNYLIEGREHPSPRYYGAIHDPD